MAGALDVPKTTASELMTGLANQRSLRRIDGGCYRLGWRLFELSQNLMHTTEFRTEAQAVIEGLVERYRETMHLAARENMQAVYIQKQQPDPPVVVLLSRLCRLAARPWLNRRQGSVVGLRVRVRGGRPGASEHFGRYTEHITYTRAVK